MASGEELLDSDLAYPYLENRRQNRTREGLAATGVLTVTPERDKKPRPEDSNLDHQSQMYSRFQHSPSRTSPLSRLVSFDSLTPPYYH